MKRRDFVVSLASLTALWSSSLQAQPSGAKIPRVGIIDNVPIWQHFRSRLQDLGYIEGKSISYEYRIANGDPRLLASAAAELAGIPVDVIATFGTPAGRAAKGATTKVPVVAISVGDPVRAGLVKSLARPGGNVTGNTILGPDLVAKRLQIIKEVVPSASQVAFLWNPDNASNAAIYDELRVAARTLHIKLTSLEARNAADFAGAFDSMLNDPPGAVLLTNDPLHRRNMQRVIDFMLQHKLAGMFQTREDVVAGGLMSYGASFPELFRNGANYVHKITAA